MVPAGLVAVSAYLWVVEVRNEHGVWVPAWEVTDFCTQRTRSLARDEAKWIERVMGLKARQRKYVREAESC